ncbi:MAG TPA: hypothetical protein VHS56_07100 [Candidatus Cybelea sp.]|jgi:hypothetical protein|nr:hypothetical protein [Candidatus Cybelea sp.]
MNTGFKLIAVVALAYLVLTAVWGVALGHQIYVAKENPLVGIGSEMVGRDATEAFAIRRLHVPEFVTKSPTFWAALRIAE